MRLLIARLWRHEVALDAALRMQRELGPWLAPSL
jgi:hypothetical protein